MVCIFNMYYKPLVLFARNIIVEQEISEEIVQGVFIKIWTDRKYLFITKSIKAYLIRAVKNKCLDYQKHERVKNRYMDEVRNTMLMDVNEDNDLLLTEELSQLISRSIDELPDGCREIFQMSRFEDMKYREIADRLGISLKTVEARMTRSMKILRERLREYL